MLSLFAYFASIENAPSSLTDNALARPPAVRNKPEPLIRCGGIVLKQGHGIFAPGNRTAGRCVWLDEGKADMNKKLGPVILSSLLFAQGLLGFAAVIAVLMKEPAAERHAAAQSAAIEGLVLVR